MIYKTDFKLISPVCDFEEAKKYLLDYNVYRFISYSKLSEEAIQKIKDIEWILQTENSGKIEVTTDEELSDRDLQILSDWIVLQNTKGIGEEFENQPFAYYEDKDYNDYINEVSDPFIRASFDYNQDRYEFEVID